MNVRAQYRINVSRYQESLKAIQQKIGPQCRLLSIVKANAYSHGMVPMAKAAIEAGVYGFGVACIEEALELRDNGILAPILVLSEPVETMLLDVFFVQSIQATVYSEGCIKRLNQAALQRQKTIEVHLKIDTGMSRVGCHTSQVEPLLKLIASSKGLVLNGVFTHFSCSDDKESVLTIQQKETFLNLTRMLPSKVLRHAANSDAIVNFPDTHFDLVRLGIRGYLGCTTLSACVMYVKEVPAQTPVSYGAEYITQEPTYIATLSIGYADGIPKEFSHGGRVTIRGRSYPVVGRVCMDMMMVNIGPGNTAIKPGDEAIIWTENGDKSLDEFCAVTGKTRYEALCSIGARVERRYG